MKWYDPGLSYVNWFVKDSSKVTSYKTTLINSIRKECNSWHRFHNVETVKNLCNEIRRTCFLFKLLTLIHSVQFPRYLIKKNFCKWKFKRYINMDIFSFDLVLNVDHCIIWSWTIPTMVTSVLEYLKIIPKCKKKKYDCCVFQKATLYYFSVLNLILRLILPRTWIYSSSG